MQEDIYYISMNLLFLYYIHYVTKMKFLSNGLVTGKNQYCWQRNVCQTHKKISPKSCI